MARVKSIFKIEGTLGELTFYTHRNGQQYVRTKSSLTKERVLRDPAFARTRENSKEFGAANRAGTLLRRGAMAFLKRAYDPGLCGRMLSVLCKVRDCDLHSVRGERTVGKGLLSAEGRRLFKGFDFNKKSPLGNVLLRPYVLESDFVFSMPSLVPAKQLHCPRNATHASFSTCLLLADLDAGTSMVRYSPAVQVPLDSNRVDVSVVPSAMPTGEGMLFWMLLVEFCQEINGVLYPLQDQTHNALQLLDVVPVQPSPTANRHRLSAGTTGSKLLPQAMAIPALLPEHSGSNVSRNTPSDFASMEFLPIFKIKNMMKNLLSSLIVALVLSACGNKSAESKPAEQDQAPSNTSSLPPVETEPANSDLKPAFAGQTRIKAVKTTTPYEGRMLTDGLDRPWGITSLPDGRLLVTEKEGTMRIVTVQGAVSKKITGLPKVNDSGQGGLLGLTIDPNFKTNRMVYWTFSEKTKEGNLTSVAKGRLATDDSRIENATVLYRATPGHKGNLHYGSRILFDKQGYLIFSTGERSDKETRPQAQQLTSANGKILRITTDGKPAPGNPFATTPNARPEIYSYGHRNVQGLAFHPVTGDLWENEFGPLGGDELNLIQPGKNYGWPTITYGMEYSGDEIGQHIGQKDGLEQPVYYWDPVLSPSGMTFYTGSEIPEWKNNLFIGGLSSTHIARLVIENNKVVGEERLLKEERQRFRDVTQGVDGALYAVTDEGRLYWIGKK